MLSLHQPLFTSLLCPQLPTLAFIPITLQSNLDPPIKLCNPHLHLFQLHFNLTWTPYSNNLSPAPSIKLCNPHLHLFPSPLPSQNFK